MPKEDKNDENNRRDNFENRHLHVADGSVDQLRAVIDRNDLDARRQPRFDLSDLCFYAIDDIEGVLTRTHHHDAGNDLASSVEVGDASAHIRPESHLTDIFDSDGCAVRTGGKDDVLEIFDRRRVPSASHHVLGAAKLEHAAARFFVSATNSFDNATDRDAIGLQAIRIDVHLELAGESAKRSHLGDAAHGLQLIAKVPILVRP